jgi:diguanylate cyclase (GGDEF)-like protein
MPSVPFVLSVLAPLIAVVIRVAAPPGAGAAINLVWLLGLVPVFLVTRYLGWKGALYGLLWATVPILITTFAMGLRDEVPVDMTALGAVIVTLAAAALGAGIMTEGWRRELAAGARAAPDALIREQLGFLPGREVLDYFLTKLFAGARRNPPLSVVLFEISDLSDHVEIDGPGVANQALLETARALGTMTRAMNVLGRYDDESFLVLLQGEDIAGAYSFAHRVLEEIEAKPAPWEGRIHLNAGVAAYDEDVSESEELIRRAEKALEAARSLGGSVAVVYGGSHEQALGISGMFILQPDGQLKEVHRTV